MTKIFSVIFSLLTTAVIANGESSEKNIWALIVAGSNGWYNYRHQADVCHAYQVLHNHGIPDERIVVMMYDDIAQNQENPTPGKIINHPLGNDVYQGVPRDYVGEDVTPENFLRILQGDEEGMNGIGSGKVIKSGPNDHVFVNFVDHGAQGLLAFPNGELTVKELDTALMNMYQARKYKQMVMYIEACESGSMFRSTLPDNINIYVTTAANYNESSYACYFDKKRETFLGDWYSVHWMEDSDKENLHQETLRRQFQITKSETNTSHVEEYGDLSISREPVADFQGPQNARPIRHRSVPYSAAPCYEVPLDILFRRHLAEKNEAKRQRIWKQIKDMQQKRILVEGVYRSLVREVAADEAMEFRLMEKRPDKINQLDCHTDVVHAFSQRCFNLGKNPYALKYVYLLANMCEEGLPSKEIVSKIRTHCANLETIEGGVH